MEVGQSSWTKRRSARLSPPESARRTGPPSTLGSDRSGATAVTPPRLPPPDPPANRHASARLSTRSRHVSALTRAGSDPRGQTPTNTGPWRTAREDRPVANFETVEKLAQIRRTSSVECVLWTPSPRCGVRWRSAATWRWPAPVACRSSRAAWRSSMIGSQACGISTTSGSTRFPRAQRRRGLQPRRTPCRAPSPTGRSSSRTRRPACGWRPASPSWAGTSRSCSSCPREPCPTPPAPSHAVVEVDEPGQRAFREEWLRAWPDGYSEAVVEQLLEQKRIVANAVGARFFLALADGRAASVCELYVRGRTAQIEDVGTLDGYRGRGLARAVVLRALAEARRRRLRPRIPRGRRGRLAEGALPPPRVRAHRADLRLPPQARRLSSSRRRVPVRRRHPRRGLLLARPHRQDGSWRRAAELMQ